MIWLLRIVLLVMALLRPSEAFGAFNPWAFVGKGKAKQSTPAQTYFAELMVFGAQVRDEQQPLRQQLTALRGSLQVVADNVVKLRGVLDKLGHAFDVYE